MNVAITGYTVTPPPPTIAFPATGQTTCYDGVGNVIACLNTGQDGDIQAGAALSYTITATERSPTTNNVDPLHDKDTSYTWANVFAVHIVGLNSAAFGGYTDWRLPNVREGATGRSPLG